MFPLTGALQYLFYCLLVSELYVPYLTSQFLAKVLVLLLQHPVFVLVFKQRLCLNLAR
jgi:hypothetical protein